MRRLQYARELLDGPLDDTLLRGTLSDLERVNRWLGGSALTWRALQPYLSSADHEPLRMLDVGTGAADIPRALLREAHRRSVGLEVVATDVRPEIVAVARERSSAEHGLHVALAEASSIDADDGAFDIVHASLLVHHLEPLGARSLLREMARVARTAVVINDLTRARHWLVAAQLLTRVATTNPYTRHDAPLSVRRAYTTGELMALGASVGLQPVARHWAVPPYRYAIVLARDGRTGA